MGVGWGSVDSVANPRWGGRVQNNPFNHWPRNSRDLGPGVRVTGQSESQTWLRYSQSMRLVKTDEVEPNVQECDELIAIFVASIRTAKKNQSNNEY